MPRAPRRPRLPKFAQLPKPKLPPELAKPAEPPPELNYVELRQQLDEFQALLVHPTLSEGDLHALFRESRQLTMFMKCYHAGIHYPDFVRHEFELMGQYRCDLVVGDSRSRNFCLIEFEDAGPNSVFVTGRRNSAWATRFENGFSQLIDWSFLLDGMEGSAPCRAGFGCVVNDFSLVLVLGRDHYLEALEMDRLRWRSKKVVVNSRRVYSITYDQLYAELSNLYDAHAAAVSPLFEEFSKKKPKASGLFLNDSAPQTTQAGR